MLVVCRTIHRDIALNALGVRLKGYCQDKAKRIFYIIYQIAYINIQTSLQEKVCLSQEKGQRRSVLSIPRIAL
jgi:hypothetical protein